MFPNGWPGRGLLLLRLGAGIVLAHDGVAKMLMAPEWHGIIGQSLATIGGVLLLIGFFTPMAGVLVVIVELWTGLSRADNRIAADIVRIKDGVLIPENFRSSIDIISQYVISFQGT